MADEQDKDAGAPARGWLTRTLFPDGAEPDPRFTLANERTFLAWMRTALALLGGGVALEAFTVDVFPSLSRHVAAVTLVLTALLVSLTATIAGSASRLPCGAGVRCPPQRWLSRWRSAS